nr:HigA family addiction module antitoxin [uncultured Desulfobulbus sp.]
MSAQITTQDHPGTLLMHQYFIPRNLTIYRVAKDTGIDKVAITRVLCGRRGLQIEEAVLLARYFGENDHFFANLQLQYDLCRMQEQTTAC